jgi:hypothetical protein
MLHWGRLTASCVIQVIRTGDRFIFVYNTASRASFEEFKFIREKLMATLIDREQRKGSMDQFLMGWYLGSLVIVGSVVCAATLTFTFTIRSGGSR